MPLLRRPLLASAEDLGLLNFDLSHFHLARQRCLDRLWEATTCRVREATSLPLRTAASTLLLRTTTTPPQERPAMPASEGTCQQCGQPDRRAQAMEHPENDHTRWFPCSSFDDLKKGSTSPPPPPSSAKDTIKYYRGAPPSRSAAVEKEERALIAANKAFHSSPSSSSFPGRSSSLALRLARDGEYSYYDTPAPRRSLG
jgi:hypothetical protein